MAKINQLIAKRKEEPAVPYPSPPMAAGARAPYRGVLMTVTIEIECGSEDISDILQKLRVQE